MIEKMPCALQIVLFSLISFPALSAAAQSRVPAKSAATTQQVASSASERDWWKNAVIYQIYPRSFQDTNKDGIGDLNGILQHMDYIQKLGVDAIWLSPVYPSPNADYGYDVADYRDINPEYGSMQDFDRLVAEANKRHIRVVMDLVMNHTSDMNSWFVQSRSSRDNPYRNWYVWRDGKGETATSQGEPPNNWGSYGHSAWVWDQGTRQYYYHHFSVHQPDLNWNNPAIEEEFKDITAYWLKHGVAGFRFDAIGTLFEDPSYADELQAKDKNGKPIFDANGHPVFERVKQGMQPQVHDVMRQMRSHIDSFSSAAFPGTRVLIGETSGRDPADLMRWYGTPDKPEFQLPMDQAVGFINKLDVAQFRQKISEAETKIGGNVPLLVLENHDRPRIDARYGDGVHDTEIERALAAILLTSGGASLVYYGEEIGMKTTPPTRLEDVKDTMEGIPGWPKNPGRDGERTPMQWNDGLNAGFSTATPWLPVPPSAKSINVDAEENDSNSLLNWYRSLIRLKKTNAALSSGGNIMLDTENTKVLSFAREIQGGSTVVVSVNFTAEPQTVNLSTSLTSAKKDSVKTLLKAPGGSDSSSLNHIELGPYGVYLGQVQ